MGLMEEKDPRFVGIEKKIGIFIAIAVIFIILSIVFIGLQREVFTAKAAIYFAADTGTNLIEGQPVKFKGFRIGKIDEVSLNKEGKVEVKLSVLEGYLKFIKADSIATLRQEGVIGDFIISISQGSEGMANVYDGSGVYFERATSVNDIAIELKRKAEEVIREFKNFTKYITDPEGDINQIIKNVRTLTDEMNETRKNVDSLLVSLRRDISLTRSELSSTLTNATTTLEAVQDDLIPQALSLMNTSESAISSLQNDMQGLMEKADKSMDNVIDLTEDMKGTVKSLPTAVEQGIELIDDSSEIMDAVKDMWPINKYIEPEESDTLPVDSYE